MAAEEIEVAGVDLGPGADLEAFVLETLEGTARRRDDRYPVDWLEHLWREAGKVEPEAADRLTRAVAAALGRSSTRVDAQVIKFFSNHPGSPGVERLGRAVVERPESFPREPHPALGSSRTLRAHAIRTALASAGRESDPDPDLLDLAHREIENGYGGSFLSGVMARDLEWAETHFEELLEQYPGEGDTFLHWLSETVGVEVEEALDRILPRVDARGRKRLDAAVRVQLHRDPETRERLRQKIQEAGGS